MGLFEVRLANVEIIRAARHKPQFIFGETNLFKSTLLSLALLFSPTRPSFAQQAPQQRPPNVPPAAQVDHMSLDPGLKANIKTAYYEAGHMMYIDLKSLAKLKQDVAAFIRDAVPSAK